MEVDEKRLWFELDKIVVKETACGKETDKCRAAINMMKFLERPGHEECRQMYIEDGN